MRLVLIGAGRVDYGLLASVGEAVRERMPVPFEVLVPVWREHVPLTLFDFARRQFRADLVNVFFAEKYGGLLEPGRRLLAVVVAGDGYVPGLNFVFGLASPEVGVASVYLARISGSRLFERLVKLVVHETGHLLGLGHCNDPRCVMRFSNSVSELDAKGDRFCPRCAARLRSLARSD